MRLQSSTGGPVVHLFDDTGSEEPCSVVIGFLTGNLYRLSFSDDCIDAPGAFRARVYFGFDPAGPPGQTLDIAPNGASTPFVDHA
jgi:hypothetical protein